MNMLRKIYKMSILSYFALFPWSEPLHYITVKCIMPLLQIVFFALVGNYALGPEAQRYIIIGNIVHLVSFNAVRGLSSMISRERSFGTLSLVFATPAKRIFILLSKSLPHIVDGMLGGVVGLVYAVVIFKVDFSGVNMFALVSVLLLISLALAGFGLVLANLALFVRNINPVSSLILMFMLFVSGVNFPVAKLPVVLQYLAQVTPLTYGVNAVRTLIDQGLTVTMYTDLFYATLLGLIYFVVSLWLFKYIENASRKKGTLNSV